MSESIKAFIINRNLLTTLKSTIEFLEKENRIEIVVYDQDSSYPPLLDYYNSLSHKIVYSKSNDGPHSVWGPKLKHEFNNTHFIIADSDCTYEGVPNDWLDKMLVSLQDLSVNKVGFSLDIHDLPNNILTKDVINWESKYWHIRHRHGWVADVDTTFALYRPKSPFDYKAVRLDKPYCIKHVPWYITSDNISNEWRYYIDNASGVSTWGSKIRALL